MVLGVFLAFAASVTGSFREAVQKHLTEDLSSLEIAFLGQTIGLILLTPAAAVTMNSSDILISEWTAFSLAVSATGTLAAVYLFFEALQEEDLSVVSPLRQISPVFVVLVETAALGVVMKESTVLGAVVSAAGAYILISTEGLAKPVRNLKNREAQLVLLVSVIYAIATVARRFGTTEIGAFVFFYMSWVLTSVGFAVWIHIKEEIPKTETFLRKDVLFMAGITVFSVGIGFFALSLVSATKYTIIKQTSGIFSVLIGGSVFSEKEILRKGIGTVLIITGVALALL